MSNKDLLKQAIAEAKTIREAAIANAKEALEESLTPHLKEMLALKLQEMEELEENMEEDATINGAGSEGYSENSKRRGNIVREEEEDETEEAPEGEEEPAKEDETEKDETEEEDFEIEEMSIEDLKDLIRDIVAQEIGQGEMPEEMPGEEAPEGADDMISIDSEEVNEEIDINEILAELEEGYKNPKKEAMKKPKMLKENADMGEKMQFFMDFMEQYQAGMPEADILEVLEGEYDIPESVDINILEKATEQLDLAINDIYTAIFEGDNYEEDEDLEENTSEELEEALATVAQLRGQLQEVNLLNAKLLYVNKVFKANNLTEGQKVNVVAAFDKAETVKEVKLVYETVSKNVSTQQPKQAIKEHKAFASKPAGTTQKQVINEVSEAVKRMQILAGIREREI